MRLSTVLLHCSAVLQSAAVKDAYLYTFNDERRSLPTTPTTISADTALSIVSRRRGSTDALSLKSADEEVLSLISEHGGYQQHLFSESTIPEPARILVRIYTDKPEGHLKTKTHPTFKIQKPTEELRFLGSLMPQSIDHSFGFASLEGVHCSYAVSDKASLAEEEALWAAPGKPIAEILGLTRSYLSNVVDLRSASIDIDFTDSKVSRSVMTSQIELLVDYLYSSVSSSNYQPSLLILPPASQLSSSDLLTKRQDTDEEPLDLTIPPTEVFDFDSPSIYKKNFTLPRRFPSCFSSVESCRNGTNDCSGHGSCKASGSNKNCFQCKCIRTTIRTNKDGSKKTNLWAGAACQKKDISVEFVLFATFGVTMMALIVGVIGMMYTMGSQELPSVIGAGVAGPTARK